MAIIKEWQAPNGVTTMYHKLIRAEYVAANETVTLTFNSYLTEDYTANMPVWQQQVVVPMDKLESNPMQFMYDIAKNDADCFVFGGLDG